MSIVAVVTVFTAGGRVTLRRRNVGGRDDIVGVVVVFILVADKTLIEINTKQW